jgi:hypothetical protein
MENFVEKELEKRPVLTIMLLAIVAVSIALGLGIVTPIAGFALKGKNWARSKFGTAPGKPASPPAPTT